MSERQAEKRIKSDKTFGDPVASTAMTPGSLEARLMAARAKRALALAERGGAPEKTQHKKRKKQSIPTQPKPAAHQPAPNIERGPRHPSSLLRKATFVFVGAAGFGLGSVLAIGFLTGLEFLDDTPATQAETILYAPEKIQQTALVSEDDAVGETPRLVGMIDKSVDDNPVIGTFDVSLPTPPVDFDQQFEIPVFSKVVYMHAESEEGGASQLRSLPQPPQASEKDSVDTLLVDNAPRVFMHAPDGIPNYSLRAVVAELEKSGIEVATIGRENFRVSSTHIRYYSQATEPVAMSVASSLGIEALDFSQNAVDAERIELWIAGRPKPVEEEVAEDPETPFDRARALRELR